MSYSATLQITNGGVTRTLTKWDELIVTHETLQSIKWTLQITDVMGNLNPDRTTVNSGVTDWRGWLDGKAYSTDANGNDIYNKWLRLTCNVDGQNYYEPTLIPQPSSYEWPKGRSSTYKMSLSGGGYASMGLRRGHDQPTLISKASGTTYQVRDVMADVFQRIGYVVVLPGGAPAPLGPGLAYDVSGVSPNYTVPRIHRQNAQGMKWFSELLDITQGRWREDIGTGADIGAVSGSDKIIAYQPSLTIPGTPIVTLDASSSAFDAFRVEAPPSEVYNQVVVQRAQDVGAIVGEASPQQTPVTYTRQPKVTFASPADTTFVHADVTLQFGGLVSDVYYYNSLGQICKTEMDRGAAPPLGGGGPAVSADFTWGILANAPSALAGGNYHVYFRTDSSAISPDASRTYKYPADPAPAIPGYAAQRKELGPTVYVNDLTTLQTWGQRWFLRNGRVWKDIGFTIPLLPKIIQDVWVQIDHARPGWWGASDPDPFLGRTIGCEVLRSVHTYSQDVNRRTTQVIARWYL